MDGGAVERVVRRGVQRGVPRVDDRVVHRPTLQQRPLDLQGPVLLAVEQGAAPRPPGSGDPGGGAVRGPSGSPRVALPPSEKTVSPGVVWGGSQLEVGD